MITDKDGLPGLRIESAASVILRDTITKHMQTFNHVIRHDRVAGHSVVAAYIDGLAGALALMIAGAHGDVESIDTACTTLRDCVARDLRHLRRV